MVKRALYMIANVVLWQLRTIGSKPAISHEEYRHKKLMWLQNRARTGRAKPQDLANTVYLYNLKGGGNTCNRENVSYS